MVASSYSKSLSLFKKVNLVSFKKKCQFLHTNKVSLFNASCLSCFHVSGRKQMAHGKTTVITVWLYIWLRLKMLQVTIALVSNK